MSEPGTTPAGPGSPTACAAGLCVLGAALMWRGLPLWWVGGACLVSAAALLHHGWGGRLAALRDWGARPRSVLGLRYAPASAAPTALGLGLITAVATLMMADVFGGERPVSFDHTVHYFKAHQLHERFLTQGRLYGWSHRWFAGYPVNYLYPIGADLWVNAVHALGLGALSFSRAYGVAFWLMHVLTGVAGYRFGKAVAGSALVGLMTGLLLITDLSAFRHGGWAYTVVYGVWPQALSLAFVLLGLCHLPAIFERGSVRPLGAFGLWFGLAILTHPIVLVFMAVLLVASALAAVFADGVRAATGVARLLMGYCLALWVACLWLLPFLSTRDLTIPMGVWWDSTYEMGRGLWEMSLLPGTIGYVLAFGLCALVLALRGRRFALLWPALMCLIVPVVFSSTFVDELRLPALSGAFAKLQYLRISTMVKPCWFALAGYFVVTFLRGARRLVPTPTAPDSPEHGRPRGALAVGGRAMVIALLVLPVVVPTAEFAFTNHVDKSLRTVRDRQFQADRERLTAYLRSELPRDGFYRLGIFTAHNHDLVDLAVELDLPIFKRGFTPCANFVYKMRTRDREVLQAVNVRYVIAKKALPDEDFEQLERFGIYRVFRYRHYRRAPYEVIAGHAQVRMRRFEDERIEFDVAPGGHGKLRLAVSWFPRWRAYRDGAPVVITRTKLAAEPDTTGFMTLPLGPGHYRVVFERSLGDRLAPPFGLAGALLCLGLMVAGDRRRWPLWARLQAALDRLSGPTFARTRTRALAGLGGVLLVAVVGLSEWRPPVEVGGALSGMKIRAVRFDFLEQLSRARVWYAFGDGTRRCRRIGERFVCPDSEGVLDAERYVASSPATIEEYRMVRCIRARPQERAALHIRFPRVPRGDAVVGYYGVEFEGRLLFRRRPVRFDVDIDGARAYSADTEEDNRMHWFKAPLPPGDGTADVRFSVTAPNVRKRWLCFHAQVVDL